MTATSQTEARDAGARGRAVDPPTGVADGTLPADMTSPPRMRFLPVSPTTFLVELPDLEATLALFESLSHQPLEGVEELVPAARTLMLHVGSQANASDLASALLGRMIAARETAGTRMIEIPVVYDGADLAEVADRLGLTTAEVIRRHTEAEYRVAFTGFAPGFAYLFAPGSGLAVPRRQTPRTRIPAGAVGLAGEFSGIYPRESPGGWQIIGTTPLEMFDPAREPASLLAPGDRVRFVPGNGTAPKRVSASPSIPQPTAPGLHILAAEWPVLVQDLGRPGFASMGVSVSGAVDRGALAAANAAVGNAAGAAALEITLGGLRFEAERPMTVAVTGAPAPITLRTVDGHTIRAPHGRPLRLLAGDEVQLATPLRGMRSYLAVEGGFDVVRVLQSAATDTLSGIGPAPLRTGDRLAIGPVGQDRHPPGPVVPNAALPAAEDCIALDVVLGPRTDWFTAQAVRVLASQEWRVTPRSSRVGIRLAGETPLERAITDELPSEGTVRGALQVPPDGQPVLFLSDHPVTGGYPVIGSVAPHHLDLAGQIPIGARIRLVPTAPFAEIVPTPETPS